MGDLISSDHVQDESLQSVQRDRDGDLGMGQVPRRSVGNQGGRIQSALTGLQTHLEGALRVQGTE